MMNKEPVFLLAFVTTIIRQLVKAKKTACKHQRDSDDWGINKWLKTGRVWMLEQR